MLIAFVPVLHKGYIALFKKYPGETLGILGDDIIADYTALTRDLRTVDPSEMQRSIEALHILNSVRVLSKSDLGALDAQHICMPNDAVCVDLAEKYLAGKQVTFENVFLRWDMPAALSQSGVSPDRMISTNDRDRELIALANAEAEKSSDFWRQIGAVIVKDGVIIEKNKNHHLPTDFHLMQNGDPRSNFDAGQHPDVYTSIHAEASAVADCARQGMALEGSSIYVSTFPCSNCARLIAESGIKKVYYEKGYSRLDAEQVLKAFGVKLVLVQNPTA